jgi:hypothetical protein
LHIFLDFPRRISFFSVEKSQVCRVGCAGAQERRGGRWASGIIKNMETDKYTKIDKSRASLILGAVGDALGAAVEFMKRDEIVAKYGDSPNAIKGIQLLDEAYGKKGAITDDTQMTLFAADGLLSAYKRGAERGILGEYSGYTLFSYLRWLETQG